MIFVRDFLLVGSCILLLTGCERYCQSEFGAGAASFLELLSRKVHDEREVKAIRQRLKNLSSRCGSPDIYVSVQMTGSFDALDLAIFADDRDLASKVMSQWSEAKICRPTGIDSDVDTRMHRVARWGSVDMISLLRSRGCALSGSTASNDTPLHASIGGVQLSGENTERLIELGAVVDTINADNSTALDYAILSNDIAALSILLDHGASIRPRGATDTRTIDLARDMGSETVKEILRIKTASEID